MENTEQIKNNSGEGEDLKGLKGFFRKHGATIGLAVLIGYVILLGIGVIAEVFKIQSILDWWIWSPPGRFK